MKNWHLDVKINPDEIEEGVFFYRSETNPFETYPERFGHSFIDLGNSQTIFEFVDRSDVSSEALERDDIRYAVDELDVETDYWILDAYEQLGEYFPAVPDVPGHPRPTNYVAIPRDAVVRVYATEKL